jgi:hypothetical protein
LCESVGAFVDETAFRCVLAYRVLVGKVPIETNKRYWNRSLQRPVLIEAHDWSTDRRLFSVVVWPSLESEEEDAAYNHMARVEQVKHAIAKGAAEMAFSTRLQTDYGLMWDHEREVWVGSDGFAYDGKKPSEAKTPIRVGGRSRL